MGSEEVLQIALNQATAAGDAIVQHLRTLDQSNITPAEKSFVTESQISIPASLHGSRKQLAEAAVRLLQLATDPTEYIEQLAANGQFLVCFRWLVNLNVLDHIPLPGDIAYSRLASLANVPESQLKGVARMAIINGFLLEPQPGMVSHSRSSALLVEDQSFLNWAKWMTNYSIPTAYKFPEATQRWGKTEVKNETAFNLAMDSPMPFFDHLRENKEMNTMFSGYMRNVASTEGVSFKHLVKGFDWARLPPGATVVDVGGSGGHASVALAKEFPQLNFVIQDLPETIANAASSFDSSDESIASRIKFSPHDFFQPQPITNANVYLLRMIIHDWPDADAIKILEHLKKALIEPGSCIIVMDTVLPRPGSISMLQERQLRVRDLTMMQVFNAKERELDDWINLTAQADLQIHHVQQPIGSNMGILQIGHQKIESDARPHTPPPSVIVNGDHEERTTTLQTDQSTVNGISTMPNGDTHNRIDIGGLDKKQLPVLIIGAGIGGLCLAQSLHKAGIDFLIFERDLSGGYRPQGYRLKLESDAADALRESLPFDIYRAFESSCAISAVGETDFNPISGTCIKSRAGGGLAGQQGLRASYTVDRAVFRSILMTGIEDKVCFGKEFDSYEAEAEEQNVIVAKFKDGSRIEGSFLVGADGSRSTLRQQHLPDIKFVDTGAVCIYGKTTITAELLRRYPGRGLKWMTVCADTAPLIQSILIGDSPLTLLSEPIRFDDKSRAQMKQLPEDYVYWVLIGRKELFTDTTGGSAAETATLERGPEQSARQSLELTKEWSPSLRSLFELQDVQQCSTMRVVSAIPELPSWKSSGLVTLIGDSIHAMSPCGGVGANTALRDAAELAKVITDAGGNALSAEAIGGFEKDLRQRAFRSLMRSLAGSKKMFDQRPFNELPVLNS